MRRPHSHYRFQKISFERDLLNVLAALAFGRKLLGRDKHVFRRFSQQRVPFNRGFVRIKKRLQIVSGKQFFQDGEFSPEYASRLFNVIRRRRHRGFASVKLHRLAHVVANADVIDNQAVILSGILSVDATDGLNQHVLFKRFVVVHVSQRRHVESRDPHVHHDYNAEI